MKKLLASHLLPIEQDSPVRKGGFEKFLDERNARLPGNRDGHRLACASDMGAELCLRNQRPKKVQGKAVLLVPNVLAAVSDAEELYTLAGTAPPAHRYVFDMKRVTFVKPYGMIALVTAARCLAERSGKPVFLENLDEQVHLYMHRMDLFAVGREWLQSTASLDERWFRSPQTEDLLELTIITGPQDVTVIASRARRIFSRWLMIPNLNSLLSVFSELYANVYEHSGDRSGCVLIQKYDSPMRNRVDVNLAVGDLGCGIRISLSTRHGSIGQKPLDYLVAAMRGWTARETGRGGLGLRRVEQIAASEGGYLWLRSETAAILSKGPGKTETLEGLTYVPGTQVAVGLHSPRMV